jgi:hypothetical protein
MLNLTNGRIPIMKKIAIFGVVLSLVGCASPGYNEYLQAQLEAMRSSQANQRPLVEIEAMPGQDIKGLKSVRVYTPQAIPQLQQSRPNEWAGVLQSAINVGGTVLGIKFAGDAASNLAKEVGSAANHGYSFVQGQQPNITLSGTGNIGSGAYTDNNLSGSGTIGGGSFQGLSGQGLIGDGYYSNSTATPTIVTQPTPVIVNQPPPIIVDPYVVTP